MDPYITTSTTKKEKLSSFHMDYSIIWEWILSLFIYYGSNFLFFKRTNNYCETSLPTSCFCAISHRCSCTQTANISKLESTKMEQYFAHAFYLEWSSSS